MGRIHSSKLRVEDLACVRQFSGHMALEGTYPGIHDLFQAVHLAIQRGQARCQAVNPLPDITDVVADFIEALSDVLEARFYMTDSAFHVAMIGGTLW